MCSPGWPRTDQPPECEACKYEAPCPERSLLSPHRYPVSFGTGAILQQERTSRPETCPATQRLLPIGICPSSSAEWKLLFLAEVWELIFIHLFILTLQSLSSPPWGVLWVLSPSSPLELSCLPPMRLPVHIPTRAIWGKTPAS